MKIQNLFLKTQTANEINSLFEDEKIYITFEDVKAYHFKRFIDFENFIRNEYFEETQEMIFNFNYKFNECNEIGYCKIYLSKMSDFDYNYYRKLGGY